MAPKKVSFEWLYLDNISTSTVQADGVVEIETDDGWRYFAADGHEIESEREIVL
jgi:hypothetical protein